MCCKGTDYRLNTLDTKNLTKEELVIEYVSARFLLGRLSQDICRIGFEGASLFQTDKMLVPNDWGERIVRYIRSGNEDIVSGELERALCEYGVNPIESHRIVLRMIRRGEIERVDKIIDEGAHNERIPSIEGDWAELMLLPREYLEEDYELVRTTYLELSEKILEISKQCDRYRFLDTPLTEFVGKVRPKDAVDYDNYYEWREKEDAELSETEEWEGPPDRRLSEDDREIMREFGRARWRRYEARQLSFLTRNIPTVGYHDENGRLILPADMYDEDDDKMWDDSEQGRN